MEVDGSLELTYGLDVAHGDDLAVNLEALLLELVSHNVSVNRTVSNASSANLSLDNQLYAVESLSLLLSLSLDGCELVSLLLEVLCENLLC